MWFGVWLDATREFVMDMRQMGREDDRDEGKRGRWRFRIQGQYEPCVFSNGLDGNKLKDGSEMFYVTCELLDTD